MSWLASTAATYLGRLTVYISIASAVSVFAATITWREGGAAWPFTSPAVMGPLLLGLGIGPALAIAASARVSGAGLAVTGACSAIAMLAFWWGFLTSDSPLAAVIFLLATWVGLPLAIAVATLIDSTTKHRPR